MTLYCGALDSSGKNDGIYQITLAAGFTATSISVSGAAAGFNPLLVMYTAGCATGDGCFQTGDAANPLPLAGALPGSYFLSTTAVATDAAGACGTTTMTTNGTFPVSLQNFSVE